MIAGTTTCMKAVGFVNHHPAIDVFVLLWLWLVLKTWPWTRSFHKVQPHAFPPPHRRGCRVAGARCMLVVGICSRVGLRRRDSSQSDGSCWNCIRQIHVTQILYAPVLAHGYHSILDQFLAIYRVILFHRLSVANMVCPKQNWCFSESSHSLPHHHKPSWSHHFSIQHSFTATKDRWVNWFSRPVWEIARSALQRNGGCDARGSQISVQISSSRCWLVKLYSLTWQFSKFPCHNWWFTHEFLARFPASQVDRVSMDRVHISLRSFIPCKKMKSFLVKSCLFVDPAVCHS